MKLRWPLVVVVLVLLCPGAPGQGRRPGGPPPGYGGGLSYSRGKVRVGIGFGPVSPFGYGYGYGRFGAPWRSYSSLTVVSLYSPPPPPVVVVQQPIVLDLGGLRLREREREPEPELPPVPDLPPPPPPKKPAAPAAKPPPPAKREVDLERFFDPPAEPPAAEHARLVKEGRAAFAEGSYGLAARRFRAATRVRPEEALPYFLLGEALLALGKYHDAGDALVAGLARDEAWPSSKFRPRELYGDRGREHDLHRQQLQEALGRHPRDSVLLFLRAHELWFAGERKEAVALFRRALPRFAEPKAIEPFLAAAKAMP